MSVVLIDQQTVHYEVLGRGRPVLFLHGWLGSWRYWLPTMENVADHFRTYSFDFWGFGASRSKSVRESISAYSGQVIRFLDALGIDRVALVGHSMGGMVAMKTALDHPTRIDRIVTVGAPFDGDALSWLLKLNDQPVLANTFARWSWLRRNVFHFFMGRTDDPAIQEVINETVKSNGITIRETVHSMLQTDLRPELPYLTVPALIIHGERDDVVNPNQIQLFHTIGSAEPVLMHKCRHFPFYDKPHEFNNRIVEFLLRQPISTNGHKSPSTRLITPPVTLPARN